MATSETMDERQFAELARGVMERVRGALDAQDPDVVEAVSEAEVLKIAFPGGAPFVLNLQRPLREVWFAADRQAWHFRYDGAKWVEKKNGDELYATLARMVAARAHVALSFA